jgi:hypothetical protein
LGGFRLGDARAAEEPAELLLERGPIAVVDRLFGFGAVDHALEASQRVAEDPSRGGLGREAPLAHEVLDAIDSDDDLIQKIVFTASRANIAQVWVDGKSRRRSR